MVANVVSEIYYSMIRSAQNLPAQYQQNLAQIFPALVQRLIDMRLMEDRGREDGLADDEQVRQRVAEAEAEAISQLWLQKRLEAAFTEEALDEAYGQWLEDNPPQDEVKARHILVEEEEQAREIIAELDAGADFAALAEEHSTDPSAEGRGGDLGFFTRDRMVAPLPRRFCHGAGTHSAEPVETQFGWHIILVEERREGTAPERKPSRPTSEIIAAEVIEDTRNELRETAEIEMNTLAVGGGTCHHPPTTPFLARHHRSQESDQEMLLKSPLAPEGFRASGHRGRRSGYDCRRRPLQESRRRPLDALLRRYKGRGCLHPLPHRRCACGVVQTGA